MIRKKKGLTTVVGVIFIILALAVGLNAFIYALNHQDKYAQVASQRNQADWERLNEDLDVTQVKIDSSTNKFNVTLMNKGKLPIKVDSLWVTNKTANPEWHQKFDFIPAKEIGSSQTITNVGTDLALTALDSKSYVLKFITERGNVVNTRSISVAEANLGLSLFLMPRTITSGENVTIQLSVKNNQLDTDSIHRINATMDHSVCTPDCTGVTITEIVKPTQLDSLDRGSTAVFKWIYKVVGPSNTVVTFTASIENGKPGNSVSDDLTISTIETAKFAEQSQSAAAAGSLSTSGGTFAGNKLRLLDGTVSGASPAGKPMHHNDPEKIGQANAAQLTLDSTITSTNPFIWYTQPSAGDATILAGEWNFWLCGYVNNQNNFLRLRTNVSEVTDTGNIVRNIVNNALLDYDNDNFGQNSNNPKCVKQDNSGPNPGQQVIQNGNRLRMDLYWDSSSTVAWFILYYNATDIQGNRESEIEFTGGDVQNSFPSFYYNLNGLDFWITVVNPGPLHLFITDDTRAIFRHINTNDTYASMVIEVNRTGTKSINENRDVRLLQPNQAIELHFSTPATIPTRATGNGNEGTRPSPGIYDLKVLLIGYDQEGGRLIKILNFGKVTIT